jgi:malate dehydrogenase (oxaloacetate-decarboxylating)
MYLEAAKAIALLVNEADLDREHIIPSVFDPKVASAVAQAVCLAAIQDNVARKPITSN